jgi:TetR/AcrR family transcriptional regulator, transcriptional repressor for nem operon
MARKSVAETAQTRRRIIDVAAAAFKSNGIEATGVAEIMGAAALTHGGFYRHFGSKEELVAEACASSMEVLVEAAEVAAKKGNSALLKHLESFISTDYRSEYLGGCPLIAMGSELARADIHIRKAVSQGYQKLFDIIAKHGHTKNAKTAREDAMYALTLVVGAVTLARTMDDPDVSKQILNIAKKRFGETNTIAKPSSRSKAAQAAQVTAP